jgi:hypothetical protein
MNIETAYSVSLIWIELAVGLVMRILPSFFKTGSGSSVGIATDYGPDVPGIESRWGPGFPPIQTGLGAHPASCTVGTGSFQGVKCGRGLLLTPRPLLVPWSWKSRTMPLHPSGPQPDL